MWKRSTDPEQTYQARRSAQFLAAVRSATEDIQQWAEGQPAMEALAARAFANSSLLEYGYPETAASIFDDLPRERAAAIERAARELFRMTDPALLSAQRSKALGSDEVHELFGSALASVVDPLTSEGCGASSNSRLLAIAGRRLAQGALASKKPSTEQLEQRGIDNVVTIAILSRWIDLLNELRELPTMQQTSDAVHLVTFDSVKMKEPLPRTPQDLLGKTRIEDGEITLDARRQEKSPSQLLTDAYLAFQVGDFTLAAVLYSECSRAGILTARRRDELGIVESIVDGDHGPIENSPLAMSSDDRLQFLIGDSPRPYLHNFPDDVESEHEQLLDAALIAEEAGRIDEFLQLVDQISQKQVPPPGLTLAVAYRSLLTNRNERCMEECRKLIDVPTYHSEDTRLRALEFLSIAAIRERNAKTALFAALEALRINISSASALMSLASLVKALNDDDEMDLLLQLRAIAILQAEGDTVQAARKLANLKTQFGGDQASFS